MLPKHAWAGVTHHHSDLLATGRLIAMHRTLDTNRLLRAEAAALQPDGSIIQQPLAFLAKRCLGGVKATAVAADHRFDRLPFPGKTLTGKAWVDCLAFFRRWLHARGFDGLCTGHR